VGAERLAPGFVHHAHTTLSDQAKDPVVAQLLGDGRAVAPRWLAEERAGGLGGVGFQSFHLGQRREEVHDLIGELGVALDVLGHTGTLTVAQTGDEHLCQVVEVDGAWGFLVHGLSPSPPSGLDPIRPFGRFKARK
jgi:hypothetical protein